jgi:limonene-1,2-epoxide hydrolase
MTTEAETRAVVESYFAAWTTNKVDAALAKLADDVEVSGPTASYTSAEAFRPGLAAFAGMTLGARIVELLVVGPHAALLYDCDLPPPVGTLRIASFFRVEKGKIRWYQIFFDATELRKVLARKSAGE